MYVQEVHGSQITAIRGDRIRIRDAQKFKKVTQQAPKNYGALRKGLDLHATDNLQPYDIAVPEAGPTPPPSPNNGRGPVLQPAINSHPQGQPWRHALRAATPPRPLPRQAAPSRRMLPPTPAIVPHQCQASPEHRPPDEALGSTRPGAEGSAAAAPRSGKPAKQYCYPNRHLDPNIDTELDPSMRQRNRTQVYDAASGTWQ